MRTTVKIHLLTITPMNTAEAAEEVGRQWVGFRGNV